MPTKFEITVMFDSTIPVDERTLEQLMLRALATKDFMLPGTAKVYAKSLDNMPRGNVLHTQPLPPHIDTQATLDHEREKQQAGAHLVSPLPPPISKT
jgi:hypothetical protein